MQVDERSVFNTARQISDAAARESYLLLACADDAAALARMRELLRVHAQEASFLESPAVASAAPEAPHEFPGAAIGPYKLLEQIGEGGFGVVFMAEQAAPVRRRVALKVIKPGMDTKQVIGRFEAERQALALMDHPNIARVFDAGATATGRPYFVMELVRGVPITEYCDAHRLPPRERLELFVTVCHAVQHAHQKGIIHRDLKPSNVLVTLHDDKPVVKVIDFGIAKATGEPLTEKTVFTAFAQMIGTPLYMSPEQASMNALDIDTRSDVYSLGVLLYELLTGTTPFEKSRLKEAAFDEVRRIIREEEPARPSTRLSTSEALPSVAANRATEPAKLTKLVRGDLDWIAMKALEKDRTRRYETANGIATDVQRYLADDAVSACPPSAGYRLRKLVRRNRRALLAGTLVAAMLLVVAGSLGWMARDSAARRARTAEAVAVLLDQCEEALKADATDRAAIALEAAERRAAEGGAGEPGGRLARCRADLTLLRELDVIDTFNWTWTNAGQPAWREVADKWRVALASYGLALDTIPAEEAAARVRDSLVRDRLVRVLDGLNLGLPTARPVLRAVDPDPYRDAVRDAILAKDAAATGALAGQPEALAQPAWFAALIGTALPGVPADRRRAVMESALRSQPGDLALLNQLAESYASEKTVEARTEVLRWRQAAVAAHPTNVAARVNLGCALTGCEDFEGATACFREALRIDPTFAWAHLNMGVVLDRRGRPDDAIASFREAIRFRPDYALAYANLGTVFAEKRESAQAIACYRKAIELDPDDALTRGWLGCALLQNGDPAGAVPELEAAVRLDPGNAEYHANLGLAWRAAGQPDKAITSLEKAVELDPDNAVVRCDLGAAFEAAGNLDKAADCYREAIRLDPGSAIAHGNLGNLLKARGELKDAISKYEEAIRLDPDFADVLCNLGAALVLNGEAPRAIAPLEKAIRLDPGSAGAHCALGSALAQCGNLTDAIRHLERAIELDPSQAPAHCQLGNVLLSKEDLAGAIAQYEKAVELDRRCVSAYANLGAALHRMGEPENAIASLKEAIRLDATHAGAYCNLGLALLDLGQFDEAVEALRKGHELGSRQPGWGYPSARWLEGAERALALDRRRPGIVAGGAASLEELLLLAGMCLTGERYVDAVQLFSRAFETDPRAAAEPNGCRYNAACAAALAAAGRGPGAEALEPSERARLRGLAHDWLRAELAAYGDLPAGDLAAAGQVRRHLQRWLDDPDLGSVREPQSLPDEERERWTKLWTDVRALMARVAQG